jgi:hypothetical protein
MRRTTFGLFVTIFALAGCGSSGTFANKPRPASPVDLTVYIDNARVSVSPASVGAGEVIFVVTNQASKAESLTIHPAGDSSRSLGSTGPINPQSTDQVTVDFARPGEYMISAGGGGGTDASTAAQAHVAPASLHVGKDRAGSSGTLLQP